MKTKNKYFVGNQVQRKRLKRFIEFFKTVKEENFDINSICELKGNDTLTGKDALKISKAPTCGTNCCIAGHLPIFNPFKFEFTAGKYKESSDYFNIKEVGKRRVHFEKIFSKYFGLTEELCSDLLYSGYKMWGYEDITPSLVVEKLEMILKGENPYYDYY